jgi:hypothetical protein
MVILVSEASNRHTHLFLVKRQYFGFNTLESVIVERISSQNNLYSYNIIADSLKKIHISENREKITVQKLKYQSVN